MFEIKVPASSANLGPGFDCFGLALQLYLNIRAEEISPREQWQLTLSGEGADLLPVDEKNLIVRVANLVAGGEGVTLPGLRMQLDNRIPLERGLGSSAAAITAGIAIVEAVTGRELSAEKFFHYASLFESHVDNLSAARYGGFTLVCSAAQGGFHCLKQPWPAAVRSLVIIPELRLDTESARTVLPKVYRRADAIFNLQHALLLQTALSQHRYELIGEALSDRFHQPYRATLVPGLAAALELQHPGLLGVALSGSGPTLLALATENFNLIGAALQQTFAVHSIAAQAKLLDIDQDGRTIKQL